MTQRRRGTSMDLLYVVHDEACDPSYQRHAGAPRRRYLLVTAVVLAGVLITIGGVQTNRQAPAVAAERAQLIDYLQQATRTNERLTNASQARVRELTALREDLLHTGRPSTDPRLEELQRLELLTGTSAVRGRGIQIIIDDSPGVQTSHSRVADIDLRRTVNGLWMAGAEAISINAHRITPTTSIRGAGASITVNYRSLNRPYRIEAIGDDRVLAARFAETSDGSWLNYLKDNYRIRYEITQLDGIRLAAVAGLEPRVARLG